MNLTIKCKLLANQEQQQQLRDVMVTFNNACNWVSEVCFNKKIFNKFKMHKEVYYETRQRFNLSSQMVIRVIGKVADSYVDLKKRETQHEFKDLGAIDYDERNFGVKKDGISISVLGGRTIMDYRSRKPLSEYKICSQCKLSYDKPKNKFYVLLSVEEMEPVPDKVENFIGVDMGIVNLATCSDGEVFSGDAVENHRVKLTLLKTKLQSKGSKSAKRHLKKISRKEGRFKRDVNHCISKKIVKKAKALGVGVKIEDLSFDNKEPVMKFNQKQRDNNAKRGKWAFGQLTNYLGYKGKRAGVPVLFVNPAYTSQKCSKCGHTEEDNRLSQSEFCCISCGYKENADVNAAVNISRAAVNQPIVATRKSELQAPPLISVGS
jgi:IS605 OrfB family transposase